MGRLIYIIIYITPTPATLAYTFVVNDRVSSVYKGDIVGVAMIILGCMYMRHEVLWGVFIAVFGTVVLFGEGFCIKDLLQK